MSTLKGITINTAVDAEAHIYAEDDAAIFRSIVGGDAVFDIGSKLAATIISNNEVRILDGVLCIGGHMARIQYGDYESCTINNGTSGKNRNDLIVAKFVTTGSEGVDTMTIEVKQGEAGDTAVDPEITDGDVYEGDTTRELALYRVRLEGLSIEGVDKLFSETPTIPQLQTQITTLNSNLTEVVTGTLGVIDGNVNTDSTAKYIKNGKVVTMLIAIVTKNSATGVSAFFLPAELTPKITNLYCVLSDSESNNSYRCYLGGGRIYLTTPAPTGGLTLTGTVTYLTS